MFARDDFDGRQYYYKIVQLFIRDCVTIGAYAPGDDHPFGANRVFLK